MQSPGPSLPHRILRFALGETVAQRCVQFALLVPAALWLRLRNSNAPWEGVLGKHIREGKPLTFDEHLKVQLWQAADICCGLLFVLVLLSPWWLRWACRDTDRPSARARQPISRRALLWLFAGLALALALRWPHFDQTILRDEQDTLRRNILGYVIVDEPGKEEPVVLDWETTLWEDAQANNPFLFSILARLSLRAWQAASGAEPWRLELHVLRLWALIPGLLSLAAIWWSLRLMGHTRAAWIAFLTGVLHPFHIDYSVQARGYALVMCFASLSPGIAWLAITEGRWRHWFALSGCFFGMLYSVPSSAYFVLSLGGALAVCLGWRAIARKDPDARRALARLGVSGAVAFLVFVPLVWPALPQAAGYLKTKMQGSIGGVWPVSAWSRYVSGVMMPDAETGREWLDQLKTADSDAGEHGAFAYISRHFVVEEPLLFFQVFVVAPLVMLAGAVWHFSLHRREWPVLAGGIGAPLLAFGVHHWVLYTFIYYWYLIYALPVVLVLFGLGLEAAAEACSRRWRRPLLAFAPTAAFLVLLLAVNRAGAGRTSWNPPPFDRPATFDRGRFLWITYPDGRTVRVPNRQGA